MLSSPLVRSVLGATPDAMVIIDSSGLIIFGNQQAAAMFGYEADALIGLRIEALMPERFRDRHVGHRRGYAENGRVRPMGIGLELFALRRDGTEFPVEISLSPIWQEGEKMIAAAIRDVTSRKRVEQQLSAARNEAERASRAKGRFLATASHDLRQPLQTLSLLNGALLRLTDNADMTEALQQQEQAIDAMSRLLNALLDVSKLESGVVTPELEDFPVATLLEELQLEFGPVAAQKQLSLTISPCTAMAHSDPSLIQQVLSNLVSNSIKYTRAGWVRLSCEQDADTIRIQVADSGVGIAPEQITYIFEEFYQVGVSTNVARDGYGLGLSIVQRIIQLLNLKMHVQSEVGKGTTFTIEIPRGVTAQEAALRPREAGGARRKQAQDCAASRHILLVEDDAAVRKATRLLLTVTGYAISTAGSLAGAVDVAERHNNIGLIITDYHLSTTETGLEVVSRIRTVLKRKIPAILVTGDTSAAVQALPRDADLRLISKPVNADELLSLANTLLSGVPANT